MIDVLKVARKLGGILWESGVWVTVDGEAVLEHDGVVRSGMRRRSIRELNRSALPSHIPTLADLYETCGVDFALSLDVKDPEAVARTVEVADSYGATPRLWLCHPDWPLVATWRDR